jgi:hypothetical protein
MEQSDSGAGSDKGVIVGSGGIRTRVRNRPRVFIIAGVVLFALIAGGMLAVSFWPEKQPEAKVDLVNLPEDYDVMTDAQIVQRYKIDTGLDFNKVRNGTITKRTMKTFYIAHTTAQALKRVKEFQKSATAYGVADELSSGANDTGHEFYLDYSEVALLAQDKELYSRVWSKYKQAIKNDKSIAPALKAEMLEQADAAERRRKLGY